jgi:hypothetical protein
MSTQPISHIVLDSSATQSHHGCVNLIPVVNMPQAFIGQKSSEIVVLSPLQVRRYRGFSRKLRSAIAAPLVALVSWIGLSLLMAFVPILGWIGSLLVLCGCYAAASQKIKEAMAVWRESKSGRVRQALCPHCGIVIVFWADALNCPSCKHRLMQYAHRLFNIV